MENHCDTKQILVTNDITDCQPSESFEEAAVPGILDLLLVLSLKKRAIVAAMLIGGLLSTAFVFLVSPIYTATAVIIPPSQQSSTAAALLGQLGGFTGVAGQSLGIKNASDPYMGILSSRTVADELIAQFELRDVYGAKTLTEARKKLASVSHFSSAKYALIQISVDDKDPKRAASLANAYIERLQEQNSRLAVTEASQRRLFYERQLELEKARLSDAEMALKKTQEEKGIFQVGSQVDVLIRSVAQLRSEIAAREVNLQRLRIGATKQNPEVLRQEIELAALRQQVKELKINNPNSDVGDPLIPTTRVPAAGLEYAQRLREVKYRESLFELLSKQYEVARIEEAKEAPIIQVLDLAIPPELKSGPSAKFYVLLGILVGGVLGVAIVILCYVAQDPVRAKKIDTLRATFWSHGKN